MGRAARRCTRASTTSHAPPSRTEALSCSMATRPPAGTRWLLGADVVDVVRAAAVEEHVDAADVRGIQRRLTTAELVETGRDGPAGVPVGPRPVATLCLLYTSPSPRDRTRSRMPSSA